MDLQENNKLQFFEDQPIRTAWDEETEEWYFSVVDVVHALTEQPDSRHAAKYWSVLKVRLAAEGSELTTNCSQLKLKAADGKRRLTNVQNPQGLEENLVTAKQGGTVAGNARKEIELQTGRSVITAGNAYTMLLKNAVVGMIEEVTKEEELTGMNAEKEKV